MKKNFAFVTLIFIMTVFMLGNGAFAETASPTSSKVLVNGAEVAFDAYNINNNNYFKLRDLAYTLNGTEKQFYVGWDDANDAITLSSGLPYTPAGGEMVGKGDGSADASPTTSKIYLNGKEAVFTAYMINGNNYFMLRDIGSAFDFCVDWDDERDTIIIDTSKGYTQADNAGAADQNNEQDPDAGNGDILFYERFPSVPSFENIDPILERVAVFSDKEENREFYWYAESTKANDYMALLLSVGYTRRGTIRNVTVSKDMIYFSKGNTHVAVRQIDRAVGVRATVEIRIVEMSISDDPTANELRLLTVQMNI